MTTAQDPTIAAESQYLFQESNLSSSLGSHPESQQQALRLPKEDSQHLQSTPSDRRPAAATSSDLPTRDIYTEGITDSEGEAAQASSVSPDIVAVEISRPCVDLSRSTTIFARPEDVSRGLDILSINGLEDGLGRQGYRLRTETHQAPRNDMVNAGIGPVIIVTSNMAASLSCRDESFLSLSSCESFLSLSSCDSILSQVTRRSTDGTDKSYASEAFTSASRASTMASAASSDCSWHAVPFMHASQPELVFLAEQNHSKDNDTPLSSISTAQKLLYLLTRANPHGRCDKQHLQDENEGSRRPRPPSPASSQARGRRSQLDQHVDRGDVPDAFATLSATVENRSTEQSFNGVLSLSLPVKRKTSTLAMEIVSPIIRASAIKGRPVEAGLVVKALGRTGRTLVATRPMPTRTRTEGQMSDRSPSSEPKRRRTLSIIEEARVEPSGGSSGPRPTADRVPDFLETEARDHNLLGASLSSSERTSETASASDLVATPREHSPATRASSVPAPMEIDSEEEAFHNEIMSDTTDESDDHYMYGDEVDSNDSEADPFNCTAKEQTSATPSGVHAWVKSVANGTTGGNAPAGNSSGAFQCMGPSGGSGAGGADNRKRRHSGADGRDVDEGRGNGHGKRPKLGEKGQRNANYACPFSKRYPPNLLPTACRKGWPEVRLVKQHLYRHHVHERCPRCHATFRSIDQLNKHLCLEQQCPIIPDPGTSIGIDRETKIKVKSRVGIQRQPEHVRWTNLYKILFPNSDEVPSPYCDVSSTSTLPNNELLQLLHGNLSESVPYEIDRKLSDYQPSLGISPSHLEIIKHVCKEVMNAKFSVFTESLEETGGVPQTTSPDLVPEVGPPSTAAENTQFTADESTHMNGGDDHTLSQFMDSHGYGQDGYSAAPMDFGADFEFNPDPCTSAHGVYLPQNFSFSGIEEAEPKGKEKELF